MKKKKILFIILPILIFLGLGGYVAYVAFGPGQSGLLVISKCRKPHENVVRFTEHPKGGFVYFTKNDAFAYPIRCPFDRYEYKKVKLPNYPEVDVYINESGQEVLYIEGNNIVSYDSSGNVAKGIIPD